MRRILRCGLGSLHIHTIRTTPHGRSRRRCRVCSAARLERGRARTQCHCLRVRGIKRTPAGTWGPHGLLPRRKYRQPATPPLRAEPRPPAPVAVCQQRRSVSASINQTLSWTVGSGAVYFCFCTLVWNEETFFLAHEEDKHAGEARCRLEPAADPRAVLLLVSCWL